MLEIQSDIAQNIYSNALQMAMLNLETGTTYLSLTILQDHVIYSVFLHATYLLVLCRDVPRARALLSGATNATSKSRPRNLLKRSTDFCIKVYKTLVSFQNGRCHCVIHIPCGLLSYDTRIKIDLIFLYFKTENNVMMTI